MADEFPPSVVEPEVATTPVRTLVTQAEAASLLGTSQQQIKRWIDRGILPHVSPSRASGEHTPRTRPGTARLIRPEDLTAFAERFPIGPNRRRWVSLPRPVAPPRQSERNPAISQARRSEGFLSSYEAAKLLGISQSTLKGWIASGTFPARLPGRYGIHGDDVLAFTVNRSAHGQARTPSSVVSLGVVAEACRVSGRIARGWLEDGTLRIAQIRGNRHYVSVADLIAFIESRDFGAAAVELVRERAATGGCKPSEG